MTIEMCNNPVTVRKSSDLVDYVTYSNLSTFLEEGCRVSKAILLILYTVESGNCVIEWIQGQLEKCGSDIKKDKLAALISALIKPEGRKPLVESIPIDRKNLCPYSLKSINSIRNTRGRSRKMLVLTQEGVDVAEDIIIRYENIFVSK